MVRFHLTDLRDTEATYNNPNHTNHSETRRTQSHHFSNTVGKVVVQKVWDPIDCVAGWFDN